MLTPTARHPRAPRAPLRALPLASLAITLLIVLSAGLGALALLGKLYVLALLFWTVAAALALGRQLAEQSRVANARFEEMTRELRLIRQTLAVGAYDPAGRGPAAAPPVGGALADGGLADLGLPPR